MKALEAPETEDYFFEMMRAKLDALPRVLEPGIAHLSELEMCPMKPYYARTLKEQPPLHRESILQFLRGRGLEFYIGGELPVLTKDGICGTIDGRWERIIEFKSTAASLKNFPDKIFPWWLDRCRGYCHLADTDRIDLVVWFVVGNMLSKKTRDTKTALRSWTLVFEPAEIAAAWDHFRFERELMFKAIDSGEEPDPLWVAQRRQSFECKNCRYSGICPYFDNGGM